MEDGDYVKPAPGCCRLPTNPRRMTTAQCQREPLRFSPGSYRLPDMLETHQLFSPLIGLEKILSSAII